MKIYDLSVTISEALPVYSGDPAVVIKHHSSIANGNMFNVDAVSFGTHTGTHADTPKHFIDGGKTCENIALDRFFGRARVLDLRHILNGRKLVEPEDLVPFDIQPGEIILLNTGCSLLLREKTFRGDFTVLSAPAARYLMEKEIKTFGIDCLSADAFGSEDFPVHHILLSAGIAVLEGLYFDNELIPQDSYMLSALPLKLACGNGSPVRAVLASGFKPKAVLFDMDGVILDTEPVSYKGWQKGFSELGYEMTEDLYNSIIGTNINGCRERLRAALGAGFDYDCASALRNEYVHAYKDAYGIAVKKGIFNILDTLDSLGIPACVATSTYTARAEEQLKSCGLGGRFKTIVGGDRVTKGKPDPEIYLKAAEAMGSTPEDCLAIEDSRLGVEAAFKGGIRVIVVPDMQKPDRDTYARTFTVCADLDAVGEIVRDLY